MRGGEGDGRRGAGSEEDGAAAGVGGCWRSRWLLALGQQVGDGDQEGGVGAGGGGGLAGWW